jgi:hypothetical protein
MTCQEYTHNSVGLLFTFRHFAYNFCRLGHLLFSAVSGTAILDNSSHTVWGVPTCLSFVTLQRVLNCGTKWSYVQIETRVYFCMVPLFNAPNAGSFAAG